MKRKIVIERRRTNEGTWRAAADDAFLWCLMDTINSEGLGEDERIHSLLSSMFARLEEGPFEETYRWRYAGPAGRPAKRGECVKTTNGRVTGYVIGGETGAIYVAASANTWARYSLYLADFVHEDGAPVTFYDPS